MTRKHGAPAGRRAARPFVLGAILLALVLFAFLGSGEGPPAPPVPEQTTVVAEKEEAAVPDSVDLPLERIDRLVAVDDETACALWRNTVVCTFDKGQHWTLSGELSSRALAVVGGGEGSLLAASEDGSIHELRPGEAPERLDERSLAAMGDRHVVDGAARDGKLYLLAHGYDRPGDLLRLPRVVETALFVLTPERVLERVGTTRGFTGDRLLLQADGGIVSFASVDARAWRSADGGKSFRRLPDHQRFGADYGGLQVAIDRWADRLKGPGRPARPASALHVSRDDGESWEHVFDTNGEVIVDFADDRVGLVVARDDGTAWLTTDGAESFRPVRRDDRLYETTAVAHLGDRFLVATSKGAILLISPARGE